MGLCSTSLNWVAVSKIVWMSEACKSRMPRRCLVLSCIKRQSYIFKAIRQNILSSTHKAQGLTHLFLQVVCLNTIHDKRFTITVKLLQVFQSKTTASFPSLSFHKTFTFWVIMVSIERPA